MKALRTVFFCYCECTKTHSDKNLAHVQSFCKYVKAVFMFHHPEHMINGSEVKLFLSLEFDPHHIQK